MRVRGGRARPSQRGPGSPAGSSRDGPCGRRRAAAKNAPRSAPVRPSASARRRTVSRWGAVRAPRSRSLIPRTLRAARSARSSCVSPAVRRSRRSWSPNPPSSGPSAMDVSSGSPFVRCRHGSKSREGIHRFRLRGQLRGLRLGAPAAAAQDGGRSERRDATTTEPEEYPMTAPADTLTVATTSGRFTAITSGALPFDDPASDASVGQDPGSSARSRAVVSTGGRGVGGRPGGAAVRRFPGSGRPLGNGYRPDRGDR